MALTNANFPCTGVGPLGSVSGGHSHAVQAEPWRPPLPERWFDPYSCKPTDYGVLCMRLRLHDHLFQLNRDGGVARDCPAGLEFLDVHRVSPDRVLVFVVADQQAVTIEDGALFPSDALITQLRLLMKQESK